MSYVGNVAEKIKVQEMQVSKPNGKSNGKSNGRHYQKVAGTFHIRHLQNSLSDKCDSLVQFQQKVVEQLEALIGKISKKVMEE